ncbi:MAG: MoxR family ATPase [Cytophagales bacterium]|nr:MAG: MoxR family ATPase [Cytophagales bacterium]
MNTPNYPENNSEENLNSSEQNSPQENKSDSLAEKESFDASIQEDDIQYISTIYERTRTEIQKIIIGNDNQIMLILAALFSGGHILLEGVPGVAKTLMAKLIAQCMNIEFKRIQFTPDLLPSDLLGVNLFNMQKTEFVFKKGPIFSNLILIDEINRSPAKTQAALFEAMEEKQITIDGETYLLAKPFFVIATQNPIEQEGTYKLPEAQLDRFLLKLNIPYPNLTDEIAILHRFKEDFTQKTTHSTQAILTALDIEKCIAIVEKVHIKDELINYIATIVNQTRNNADLFLGASPRASLAILKTSKALAALQKRDYVTPDDIQTVCYPVLCHRIILSPEKEMEGVSMENIILEMIKNVEVPR